MAARKKVEVEVDPARDADEAQWVRRGATSDGSRGFQPTDWMPHIRVVAERRLNQGQRHASKCVADSASDGSIVAPRRDRLARSSTVG